MKYQGCLLSNISGTQEEGDTARARLHAMDKNQKKSLRTAMQAYLKKFPDKKVDIHKYEWLRLYRRPSPIEKKHKHK